MADELKVDPAELRRIGNANYNLAAYYRELGKPDEEAVASWSEFGSGLSSLVEAVKESITNDRPAAHNALADEQHDFGDLNHGNASRYEVADDAAGGVVENAGEAV